MRTLCVILSVLLTGTGLLSAETHLPPRARHIAKLIYQDGCLINKGEEALLNVEITEPFYRYIGNMQINTSVDVSYIKTKFTVQYTARQWAGANETMKETFIPRLDRPDMETGLDVQAYLQGNSLRIIVSSARNISDVFIEVLSDIPIRISDDRVRYILSSVGIKGQNLKRGLVANFNLCLLQDQAFYKVPVQVTYVYGGVSYDKVFSFSFKKEDFKDEASAS